MEAKVIADTSVRTITIKVSGVPDMDAKMSWQRRSHPVRPDEVEMTIREGRQTMRISGPVVLKSGELSERSRETIVITTDHDDTMRMHIDVAPEWVGTLWNEAPRDVKSWRA